MVLFFFFLICLNDTLFQFRIFILLIMCYCSICLKCSYYFYENFTPFSYNFLFLAWLKTLLRLCKTIVLIYGHFAFQGHIYNSTSRIKNRKEKKSWLGYAQVGGYLKRAPHFATLTSNLCLRVSVSVYCIVPLALVTKESFGIDF